MDPSPMNGQDEEADGVPTFSEFSDPRLVAIYDAVSPIAERVGELAKRGHRVIGVEPSGAMLALARCRRCGEQVEWTEGDALRLGEIGGEVGADRAIMLGHVAQIIRDDEVWPATLAAVREALGPDGRVACESRNALAREWTAWTPQASRRRVEDAVAGPVKVWFQNPEVDGDLVRYEMHYHFARFGEELVSHTELKFRTRTELSRSLSMPASRWRAPSATGAVARPTQRAAN